MENSSRKARFWAGGAALLIAAGGAHANVLTNPGFETGLAGWNTFGNVFAETVTPRTGAGDAKMFGNFSGGFNVSGMFQSFPASPGQLWSLDAYFRHNTGDNLTGAGAPDFNWVVMKFEFRDAGDSVVGFAESIVLDGTSPTDVWLDPSPISSVAPANTASVWAFFLYLQPAFDGGAVLIDDAQFIPSPHGAAVLALGALAAWRRRRPA